MNKFWQIKNEASQESAEILLYGDIASEKPWWSEGDTTTPKEFASDLVALGGKPVTVRINSMGGDVFAAHAIFNQLRTYSGKVTVLIDSVAASAASIVAMAGNPVIMPSNTMMMIHKPMLELWGYYNTDDLSKMSDALDNIQDSIVSAYMAKSQLDRKKLSKMMDEATWMTAEQCKEYGLCDEVQDLGAALNAVINGNFMVVNSVQHDLTRVKNADQLRQIVNASKPAPGTIVMMPPSNQPQNNESILAEVKKLITSAFQSLSPQNKNSKEDPELEIKNIEDLIKAHPDLVNQIINQAGTDAVKNEQDRIKALDALDDGKHPAVKDLVADAKNSGKTADDIKAVVDIVKKHAPAQNKGLDTLNKVVNDNKSSGIDNVQADGGSGGQGGDQEEVQAVNFMANVINNKFGRKDGK